MFFCDEDKEDYSSTDFKYSLLVRTEFDNTSGVYEPLGLDRRRNPQWRRRQGRSHLYKHGRDWVIGPKLGGSDFFDVAENSGAKTPLDVPEWTQDAGEIVISQLVDVDTTGAPKVLSVESKFRNIAGGYERLDEDFDGYPAYCFQEGGKYLYHIRSQGAWVVSDRLSQGGIFCIAYSTSVDVCSGLSWQDDGITNIEEVVWENVPDDDGFRDAAFPANHASLGDVWLKSNPQFNDSDAVEWIRAPHLNRRRHSEELFGPVCPSDIAQGKVRNCWLIAALSCVAEFPRAIQDLVEPKELAEDGRYSVRLYDVATGSFVDVVLDDLVPCEVRRWWQREGAPLFAHVKSDCVWPVILEKAFAKFCLNYGCLDLGSVAWAWQALTGCEEQLSYNKTEDGSWLKAEVNLEAQRSRISQGDRRACPFQSFGIRYDDDQLWRILKEGDEANLLMGASIRISAGASLEHMREDGLVEGHAYSVISAVECKGFRLLKLRNPWGDYEWNGDWSDGDKLWDINPDVTAELSPEEVADGVFWIDWDDFTESFTTVNICPKTMMRKRSDGQACVQGFLGSSSPSSSSSSSSPSSPSSCSSSPSSSQITSAAFAN